MERDNYIVTYKQALTLKSLGYNGYCKIFYTSNGAERKIKISDFQSLGSSGALAPGFIDVKKWFKIKYNIDIRILPSVPPQGLSDYMITIEEGNTKTMILSERTYNYKEGKERLITKALTWVTFNPDWKPIKFS